jgi:hypothetical protein
MVTQTYNPTTWGGWTSNIVIQVQPEVHMARPYLKKKKNKLIF